MPLLPQFLDMVPPLTEPVKETMMAKNEELSQAGASAKSKSRRAKGKQSAVQTKTFVLDTNVLLHDPGCLQRFGDNHLCIPVDVLSELDRFKTESSDRGANAREVHRALTTVFKDQGNSITQGVPTLGGGSVRLVIYDPAGSVSADVQHFQRVFPALEKTDHRILACTLALREQVQGPVILVSKDLNMQLKARSVGIVCEDYLNDKVEAREVLQADLARVEVTVAELQKFNSCGRLEVEPARCAHVVVNEYVMLAVSEKQTIPARLNAEGQFVKPRFPESLRVQEGRAIRSMNLGQACLLDALLNPEISLVTVFGQAGTGKTLLSVAAGLTQILETRRYHGLTVSRPIVEMGKGVGFLPGALEDKMRPWLQPIYDALDFLLRPEAPTQGPTRKRKRAALRAALDEVQGRTAPPYDALVKDGTVEIEALCYIRGRSIPDRFFILDEAQQLTPLEAKTVVTRMSKGSKLVLVGDPAQIDNPYVDSRSNGLVYTRQKMRGQPFAAHISLSKGERSPLAEAAARLM
jgi:PhoH-like ATPase